MQIKFNIGKNTSKKYKVEAIKNNAIYAKDLKSSFLLGFFIIQLLNKIIFKKKIQKPYLATKQFKNLISLF